MSTVVFGTVSSNFWFWTDTNDISLESDLLFPFYLSVFRYFLKFLFDTLVFRIFRYFSSIFLYFNSIFRFGISISIFTKTHLYTINSLSVWRSLPQKGGKCLAAFLSGGQTNVNEQKYVLLLLWISLQCYIKIKKFH